MDSGREVTFSPFFWSILHSFRFPSNCSRLSPCRCV
jgi:hypothetical protein